MSAVSTIMSFSSNSRALAVKEISKRSRGRRCGHTDDDGCSLCYLSNLFILLHNLFYPRLRLINGVSRDPLFSRDIRTVGNLDAMAFLPFIVRGECG